MLIYRPLTFLLVFAFVLTTAQSQTAPPMSLQEVAAQTGIAAWHDAGYIGAGVKVGVIDLGFARLDEFSIPYTLPPDADMRRYLNGGDHGTRVLTVIHTLAPGASLYIYQLDPDGQNLPAAVDWMMAQGVQVVNYSVTFFDLPLTGDNFQGQQMTRLADAGIVVVTAAGNHAQGFLDDTFRDRDGDGWHEFSDGGESRPFTPLFTYTYNEAHLRWEDVYTSAAYDLDVYIFPGGTTVPLSSATRIQQGRNADWPYEDAIYPSVAGQTLYVSIRAKIAGTVPEGTRFHLYVENALLTAPTLSGSVTTPADHPRVLSVGALEADGTLWARSGRGPTWDGRIKPDLAAPGRLFIPYFEEVFLGTSASTPVVTAAVALVRGYNPAMTEGELRRWMSANAWDAGQPGIDNLYGSGRLHLPPP